MSVAKTVRQVEIAALEEAVQLIHWIASLMGQKGAANMRQMADTLSALATRLKEEERGSRR